LDSYFHGQTVDIPLPKFIDRLPLMILMAQETHGERIARLEEKFINAFGDIEEIKEQLKKITNYTGPTHSDLKALKRAVFEKLDLDALGNPLKYDAKNHPSRRASDKTSLPPMVIDILKAVITFVLGGVFLWLATDILPRIFSITTG